ncbi:hypothetical protein RFF05_14425 [Bengtsoniella intestinalis]|uniref:hypothetical protein n=1 Tax=Bengtsoniella intestinalis TaxID=3073143 RepID=UPI00391F9E5E
MKFLRFDTAMWVLSMGGLGLIVVYYLATAHLGVDLPYGVAMVGVGMVFFANGLLFARWSNDLFGFVKKKEYLAAVILLLLGLLIWLL